MPFKSEKQRKWMWANDPEMAKKWEKEEKMKRETKVKQLIKKMVREMMKEDFAGSYPAHMRKGLDKKRRKQSEVLGYKLTGKDDIRSEIGDATSHTKSGDKYVEEGKLTETKFYAFWNRKKYTINGKSLYDAKQKAITQLKVPKRKVGLLAVVNAKEHDRGSFRFEGKLTEAHRSMSNNVAKEIIRQLGGKRFQMMTGAKKFIKDKKALFFKIGRNSKKINGIRIYYNSSDLYDIEFLRVSKNGIKVAKKLKNIYADQLQEIFTRYTGMYTAL